jgi:outer membrane protein assembly factor BamA
MSQSNVRCLTAFLTAGIVLAASSRLLAQTPSPLSLKLTRITFSGLRLYTQEMAEDAGGLRVGQTVKLTDLGEALSRLMASGLFKTAHYRYTYNDTRAEVVFDVEEEKWNTPVVFDNFVWFSDDEIDNLIRKKFPFFRGPAPDSTGVLDAIKGVLEQLLADHNLSRPVEYISQVDVSGRNKITLFTAKGDLPVCEIQFPGADQARQAELAKSAVHFIGDQYSRSALDYFAGTELVSLYAKYGYLKASFDSCTARQSRDDKCKGGVVVSLLAKEGPQYRCDGAVWRGNQALTQQQLDWLLGMKKGEVANTQKIEEGLKRVRSAYRKQAYLTARIVPATELHDDARLVTYRYSVDEGPQYRMGKVMIKGLSESEAAKVKTRWKLAEGALFDDDYVSAFVTKNLGPRDLGFIITKCKISMNLDKQKAVADAVLDIQK